MNNIIGVDRLDKNKRILIGSGICKECGGETRITSPYLKPNKQFYFSKRHQCLGECGKLWLFEEDKIYTNYVAKNTTTEEIETENKNQSPRLFD